MVLWVLRFRAELENVESITFPGTMRWYLDVKHSTGDEIRERIDCSSVDSFAIPNSRGTCNFCVRWEGTKQTSTLNVKQVAGLTRAYTNDAMPELVPIVAFECRGLEPIKWHPSNECSLKTQSGQSFHNVDLSEDWCDYDMKKNIPIGVYKVEYDFQCLKGYS
ncbi:DUF866 domain-containing protein [Cardiosporidium cionae]|uniref:DUF866 domain-containing protein n=1 Tax=Cardiosporidium cionae TaxID=476202 RepID=A0ABQ7J6C1_9APIC|nr:DUF866 domain-containing protein [Cardiosporidium cionae]|eukprot:KAF8819464.1 DUF866 domain-containing protein [Cardiosporidium cionae]